MVMKELQEVSQGEVDKQEDHGDPPVRKPGRAQVRSSLDSVFDEIALLQQVLYKVRDIPWRDHNFSER